MVAIVLQAVFSVGSKALKNFTMVAIAAIAFVAIFQLNVPFPMIILVAGLVGYIGTRVGSTAFRVGGRGGKGAVGLAHSDSLLGDDLPDHVRPSVRSALRIATIWLALWLLPVGAVLAFFGPNHILGQIAIFFSEMAVVTFGGAYAVLAYVAQQAVEHYH